MTLLDLSQVTKSLVRLLETKIKPSLGHTFTVVPDPPESLSGENTLGIYLYHVQEDPFNKNLQSEWTQPTQIRFTPMPLNLYYVLTAHSDLISPFGTYREQHIMGCALKTLHDYPVLDDNTKINGTQIFPLSLQDADNRLKLEMRPVSVNEATQYWTANSKPLRFSAYYEVSIILIEPEKPPSRAGRVLAYNVFAFPGETPHLTSSSNVISFKIPDEGTFRQVTQRPAQVPFGGTLHLDGSSLTGDRTSLLLNYSDWGDPIEVDRTIWNVTAKPESLEAVIQNTAGSETLVPGIYGAVVEVERKRPIASGVTRSFVYRSNETPFVISPKIETITIAPSGSGTVNGCVFEAPGISTKAVNVFVEDVQLVENTAGPLSAGEYVVKSDIQIDFQLPTGLTSGKEVPFRLIINGAESPPKWIPIP